MSTPRNDPFEAPDPYEKGLQALRAAESFEDRYKRTRTGALMQEHFDLCMETAAVPSPRLTTAQLAEFEAPNGYQIALDALREVR